MLLGNLVSANSPFQTYTKMTLKVTNIVLVLALATFSVKFSTSSPLENVQGRYANRLDHLQAAFELKFNYLMAQLEEERMQRREQGQEIIALKEKIAAMESARSKPSYADHFSYLVDNNVAVDKELPDESSLRAVAPTSCLDLSRIGHTLDGMYMVANKVSKRVEVHFCDFGTTLVDDLIGHADVKTTSVHFYAQRNVPFTTSLSTIPYQIEKLNVGKAMDVLTGVFTAPVSGTYHFEFHGVKEISPDPLEIFLQVDGMNVGAAVSTNEANFDNLFTLSLSASLQLQVGQRVNMFKGRDGVLKDDDRHSTHFTGLLVEEDLIIS